MYHGDVHVGCEVPGPVSLYFRDLACLTFTSDHYELYCYHHSRTQKMYEISTSRAEEQQIKSFASSYYIASENTYLYFVVSYYCMMMLSKNTP